MSQEITAPRQYGYMWWVDRWRKSTAFVEMSLEQQGAYRNLLDEARVRGGCIPADDQLLARASGDPVRWPKLRQVVLARFERTPQGWRNQTLDQVLLETARRATKQRAYRGRLEAGAGNTVGNARGNAGGNRGGNGRGNARGN
jgi:uncharacterized protein YdaU (DUF1376 family)